VAAELGRHLQDYEPVRPGDEPALAAEVSELGQDRERGIPRGLVRDVVEFRPGHRGGRRPAADLRQRDADRPRVQLTLGRLPDPARSPQAAHPGGGLLVQAGGPAAWHIPRPTGYRRLRP
jgi:hypothetical protein